MTHPEHEVAAEATNPITSSDADSAPEAHPPTDAPTPVAEPLAAPAHPLDHAKPLDPRSFPNPPRAKGSAPPTTIANVQFMLAAYGITARYNVIRKRLVVTLPGHSGSSDNFDSTVMTQIQSLAVLNGLDPGRTATSVSAIGDRHQFNPVAEWIHSRPWDGQDRLPEFYATLVEREDFPREFKETLMHRWALSAVAAALVPAGFRCRGVLTLQGPQGIGKTAWVRSLVSDPDMSRDLVKLDHHLDPSNKDSVLSAIESWIVEIGELDGSLRRDIARLKGCLTADKDKVRRPYAAVASEYPRRTVFVATVNDSRFLVDTTGNSRWWTIPLTGINAHHGIDMQQLYAQLAVELAEGGQWWLTREEEARLELQNKEHRSVSAVEERILDFLERFRPDDGHTRAFTAIELLRAADIDHPSNAQCKEAGAILRDLYGPPKRINGRDKWHVPIDSDWFNRFDI